jgi:Tol biopolymer transport system component
MMKKISVFIFLFLIIPLILKGQDKRYIAYSSDNTPNGYFQVFIMDEDGNNKRQLTYKPTHCIYPMWSTDGTKITFYSEDEYSESSVYVISNIFSSEKAEVEYILDGTHPIFTHEDDGLLFNSDMDGLLTIYVKIFGDPDVYLMGVAEYANQQTLSKDGRWLSFSMLSEEGKSIMMYDLLDTTEDALYSVSKNKNANMLPDISYDAGKIVYSSFDQNLNGSIYIYEEGVEKNLTKDLKSSDQPKFSPNAEFIGFVSIEGENVKLYYMKPDGTEKTKINIPNSDVGSFVWFDNETIVYDAEKSGKFYIGKVNIKTGENIILSEEGNNIKPSVLIIPEEE